MSVRGSKILENAVRRDEATAAIVALRPQRRQNDLDLARQFHDVAVHHHYAFESCASIREYGEKHGFSAHEAKTLAAAGHALVLQPEIEDRVLRGRITLEGAAALARIYRDPRLIKEGDDWLATAETEGTRTLWRMIRERIIEVDGKGPPSRLDVVLTTEDRDAFERARQVVCEKEREVLNEGRTIGWLSNYFLDAEDPDRVQEGKRRVGNTAHVPSRYVPVSVKRKVRRRARCTCQWPGCENRMFLRLAHRIWHASGGSREAGNILLLCELHHAMLDAGWIRVRGSSEAPRFYEKVPGGSGDSGWRRVNGVRAPPR